MNSLQSTTIAQILVTQAEGGGEEGQAAGPFGALGGLLPLVLMFAVIYLLLIRPANKQRKQHQELLNQLKKDDEVVTTGGFWGRIVGIDDKVVTLEIADKIKIKIMRDRVAGRWNPQGATPKGK